MTQCLWKQLDEISTSKCQHGEPKIAFENFDVSTYASQFNYIFQRYIDPVLPCTHGKVEQKLIQSNISAKNSDDLFDHT